MLHGVFLVLMYTDHIYTFVSASKLADSKYYGIRMERPTRNAWYIQEAVWILLLSPNCETKRIFEFAALFFAKSKAYMLQTFHHGRNGQVVFHIIYNNLT